MVDSNNRYNLRALRTLILDDNTSMSEIGEYMQEFHYNKGINPSLDILFKYRELLLKEEETKAMKELVKIIDSITKFGDGSLYVDCVGDFHD